MNVPGSNLLNLAMTVLAKQTFQYLAYADREANDIGFFEDDYATPVTITGSAQPVARNLYSQMGLDFQKNYHTFFLPDLIGDVKRGRAGDKFIYNNQTWQCLSTVPWFAMDGWTECTCVQVPNENTDYISEAGFAFVTEDSLQHYTQE